MESLTGIKPPGEGMCLCVKEGEQVRRMSFVLERHADVYIAHREMVSVEDEGFGIPSLPQVRKVRGG